MVGNEFSSLKLDSLFLDLDFALILLRVHYHDWESGNLKYKQMSDNKHKQRQNRESREKSRFM